MSNQAFGKFPTVKTGQRGRPAIDWVAALHLIADGSLKGEVECSTPQTAQTTRSRILGQINALGTIKGIKGIEIEREDAFLRFHVEQRTKKVPAEVPTDKSKRTRKAKELVNA